MSKKEKGTNGSQKLQLHHKCWNRRQFLAAGVAQSTGFLLMPTILDVVFRAKMAEAAGAPTVMPFLVFDGAGGFGMPSIFLPGGQGGPLSSPLTDYSGLGYASAAVDPKNTNAAGGPAFNTTMGVPIQSTAFLNGVTGGAKGLLAPITAAGASPAGLKLMTICHTGQDDSSGNRQSAVVSVSRVYAAQAKFINTALGTRPTASGGNSSVPNPMPTLNPLNVTSVNDVLGAVGLSGPLGTITQAAQGAWAKLVSSLTAREAQRLSSMYQGTTFAQLANDGNTKNSSFVQNVGQGVDPRQNATVAAVYGITAASTANDPQVIKATIAMNVLQQNSGPGVYTVNGCDYHDNQSGTKDKKDAEIGQAIGEAVATAFKLNQKFMFQIITDGGVNMSLGSSDTGGIAATGDNGIKSMTVLGYYDPAVADSSHYINGAAQNPQLGFYTPSGAVGSTLVGAGNAIVASAVVANYLNTLGRIADFNTFSPVASLSSTQVNSLLVFA